MAFGRDTDYHDMVLQLTWLDRRTGASAVPKMPVDGRSESVIFFDGVFFHASMKSIFFAS